MANRLKKISLFEVSLVDKGANPHAHITLFKREQKKPKKTWAKETVYKYADAFVAFGKSYYGETTGAQTFDQLIIAEEERRRQYEASEKLWPLFCAVQESIRSIIADSKLTNESRIDMIRQSVQSFMNAVADEVPDIEADLDKILNTVPMAADILKGNRSPDMDWETKAKELQKQIDDMAKKVAERDEEIAKLKADIKKADDDKKALETDEVLKVGDQEIRKSKVGESTFAAMKAQQVNIDKANDQIELNAFEKKANDEIPVLPGTSVEKGKALRAIEKIADEPIRKTVQEMLKAGNSAIADLTKARGSSNFNGGDGSDDEAKLEALAKKYAEDHKVSITTARSAVLDTPEGREIYKRMDSGVKDVGTVEK